MDLKPNSEVQLPPDLDKARDEKCIPVAQEILGEMAGNLLVGTPGEAGHGDSLMLSILKKMLAGSMNITTEAQYLFQLLLGGFSGLNGAVHTAEGFVPLDEERYARIGQAMLQILSDAKVRLTKVKPEEIEADWVEAKVKLKELFTTENVNKLEAEYVIGNIFEAFKAMNNRVAEGLSQSTARAEAKIFGIGAMDELTITHVNDVLVNDLEVKLTPPTPPAPPPGAVEPPPVIPEGGSGAVEPPIAPVVEEPAPPATPGEETAA